MATTLREKPTAKHDAFITSQLDKARQRIRLVDLATAIGAWVAGTLAFLMLVMLLDRAFVLAAGTRQLALVFFLAASATYLWFAVVRPLRWQVNPHYAARQLEGTLPGTRNHVINWIDLHGEPVPGVLRASLGARAAKDLAGTDVEQAISNRRAVAVGTTAGLLLATCVVLFVLFGPGPFASLMSRAFAPFGNRAGIATRTQVQIVRPAGGDATVSINSPVTIAAEVSGRVPEVHDKDAPCLLYRTNDGDPYRKRLLLFDEFARQWSTTVSAADVGTGFWYKLTAGDGETPEHRIGVRAGPLIGDFVATYRYRPYVQKADRSRITRKIEDLYGTDVSIIARTNRAIKDARLDIDVKDGTREFVRPELLPADPQALRFRFPLDKSGTYRIRFTSTDGEQYLDASAYEIVAHPDLTPEVSLAKPGKDTSEPANGHVELAGEASDDHGIAGMALRLQVVGGGTLQPKPYLADKLGKPEVGTPRRVEYKDVLDLGALKDELGKPAELKPGMQLEYWLEATDACDAPKPNVGASQKYKITLTEPKGDEQKKKDEAKQRQKENEKQQEQQLKNDKAERDKQRAKEEEQNRKDQQQPGEKGANEPKQDGQKGEQPDQKQKDDETRDKADQLKDALDKNDKKDPPKEADNKPGEGKGEGDNKPAEKNDDGKDQKDDGKKDEQPGKGKEGGRDGKQGGEKKEADGKDGDKQPGEARDGKPEQADGKEGARPNADDKAKPGEGKPAEQPKPQAGNDKGKGNPDPAKRAGEKKPEGDIKPEDKVNQGQAKDSKTEGKPTGEERPGEAKEGAKPTEKKGEGKPGEKKENPPPDQKPGESKPNAQQEPKDGKPGACKDCPNGGKPGADGSKPGESKGQGQDAGEPKDASKSDKAGQGKPGQDKPGEAPGKAQAAEKKPGEVGGEQPGEAKPMGKDGKEKGQPGEVPAKDGQGPKKEGDAPPGQAKGEDTGNADKPGDGMQGDRRDPGRQQGETQPARPEKPVKHRASTLQLEQFRKKVNADVLKDAKMSEEQYKKFLADYAELAKRQERGGDEVDTPPAPGRSGTLPSMGGKKLAPAAGGKNESARGEGRAKPPPEYRGAYEDFLRRLPSK